MTETIAICSAIVIDTYTGEKAVRDILIQGERIKALGPVGSFDIPADAKKIDARGCYAIPGLWDAHIHVTKWPEVEDRLPTLLTAFGITSVRDMGAALDHILEFRHRAMQADAIAPRIWFAGPFINSSPAWGKNNPMSIEVDVEQEAIQLIDSLVRAGIHFVKTYEMLLPEVFEVIAKRAKQHGLRLAGHTPMRMTIPEILDIVPDYDIQHQGGICSGMVYECSCEADKLHTDRLDVLEQNHASAETGVALMLSVEKALPVTLDDFDPEKRSALIELFVEKGAWQTPTLIQTVSLEDLGFQDSPERLKALEYLPKKFLDKREKIRNKLKNRASRYKWGPWYMETVGLMYKAGVPLLAGTDCPPNAEKTPGLALHFELEALVKAGVSTLAALQSATLNPAKFFAIEDDLGSLAVGRFADLLLLEKDPLEDITNTRSIVSVLSRGHYLDRQALDDLFESMIDKPHSDT